MRIAVYHNLHSGGAKRVVIEHLRHLSNRHEVTLYSLSSADHRFAESLADNSIPSSILQYHPLPWLRSPFGRLNPLVGLIDVVRLNAMARETAAQIDHQNFDVVLVHPCQVTQTPLVIGWLNTPTLYYCHELPRRLYEQSIARPYNSRTRLRRLLDHVDLLQSMKDNVMRQVDRWNARRATQIVANSLFTSTNASIAYDRPIEVCYPGVDVSAFQPPQVPRERLVLSVGALTPAKGFDFIIQSLATLPAERRPPFVIVSNYQEPAEWQYLATLAENYGVTLQCLTNVSDTELQTWYRRAGCVAYTPIREPLGLVALEAMAAGTPLAGIAEGGVAETIVDGVSGLLAPRDPGAFGAAIQRLLDNPALADELGRTARQYVIAQWTWDRHTEQVENHLRLAAGKP